MLDTLTRPETEPDERPEPFNRRRLVRWVAVLTIGVIVVLAVWQDPLYAGRV